MDRATFTERVGATYERGALRPERPLRLLEGEHVELILVRPADARRWDLARLGAAPEQDRALAESGLAAWADDLDRQDRR